MLTGLRAFIIRCPSKFPPPHCVLHPVASTSQISLRYNQTYRNRYTHFSDAYPRKVGKGYVFIGLFVVGGIYFTYFERYAMGLVNDKMAKFSTEWLSLKLDQWSQRKRSDSKPTKVDCQTEYHSKKGIENVEDENDEKPRVKNTFRTRKVCEPWSYAHLSDPCFLVCGFACLTP